MRGLYSLFIQVYYWSALVVSLFNRKAKKWVSGRIDWEKKLGKLNTASRKVYWFHFASLGEFEQGRPIIEKLKRENPELFLLITFFSPSGYEVRKDYKQADYVCYLPIDTPLNAKEFIELVRPNAVFFIKYEFWFNYLKELKRNKIPVFLVSGIFRKKQHFFSWYGSWFRKQLLNFTWFFVQNEESKNLLNGIGLNNVEITGDTRFDRVREIAGQKKDLPLISQFTDKKEVFIIGSSWSKDDDLLAPFVNTNQKQYKFIIAPHNIQERQIESITRKIKLSSIRYSKANEQNIEFADVMIIDSIGLLSSIYQYGTIAYIGGGFGSNVHNILEAAVYGLPTIFGPNYHKFQECKDLVAAGGAYSILDYDELIRISDGLKIPQIRKKASVIASAYVLQKSGATELVFQQLKQFPAIFPENTPHIQS